MESRIEALFAQKSKDIVSVYYPAGYPSLDSTREILAELQAQGADMVELGIPFSDPMADGAVIQAAANKALENGMSLKLLFEQISTMRGDGITIPVILMGYLNPIMHFGFERFCEECVRTGVDGVIIPDLPFKEYMDEYKATAEKHGIKVVMFISPETSEERIRLIDENASGFIYMVSTAGTTGARSSFADSAADYFKRVDAMGLQHPRLIGFGISSQETFAAACANSNGAIVGSHFVKLLAENSVQESVKKLLDIAVING
ncbi:MAG: tryptophan synthase subunit alpha [Rikenellaceae bacterium]